MNIEVEVLGKYKMAYGTEVDVAYTCPHCGANVTDTICFSSDIKNCVADVSGSSALSAESLTI